MLTVKTFFGAGWSVSSRLAGRAIDFVTLLILARTLNPADFGLTALAMTLTVVIETVLEIPLTQALTRLRVIEKESLDTAFTLGTLRSLVLATLVVAAAWPFAKFYNDDRLVLIVMANAIAPIARGLYSPGMVHFTRNINFRPVFIAEFSGKIVAAALAITTVTLGGGYWAIVVNSVAASTTATILSYVIAPYRPAFSLAAMSQFAGFIGWFSSAQFVSALNWQFDRVLLGRFVGKAELGQYTMAGDVAALPTQSLIGPAMQPVMSAFSAIADRRERLQSAYLKASRATMMLAMPACLGMALTADLVVSVLLGPKWADAAFYLQWLALTITPNAYFQALYSMALAVDRPVAIFRLNATDFAFRLVLISLGFFFFGLPGVIAARGIVSTIMFGLTMLSARSLIGVGILAQLRNLQGVAGACIAMTAAVLALRSGLGHVNLGVLAEFACLAGTGALVYFVTLFLLRAHRTLIAS